MKISTTDNPTDIMTSTTKFDFYFNFEFGWVVQLLKGQALAKEKGVSHAWENSRQGGDLLTSCLEF